MWLKFFMKKIIQAIKTWWYGEDIFHENNPNDPLIFIGWRTKRHWTSRIAHSVVNYMIKHQAWIIPTIITAVVAIVLARPWKW